MLWNVFLWEQVLAQGAQPVLPQVLFRALCCSRWQPSLLVWLSCLVGCTDLSVCNRYREFLKREKSALSCLKGCQVLWGAKSGPGMSTFFPFAIWCYSWLHCEKDLRLRERNSEGGQMAGVWTFFRPCASWIHLLCFVCQNMSLLWATKATGFKINKFSPQGWQPRWLLCDPILLLQEAMRTANEFTSTWSPVLACIIPIQEAKVNTTQGSLLASSTLSTMSKWEESLTVTHWVYSCRGQDNGKAVTDSGKESSC